MHSETAAHRSVTGFATYCHRIGQMARVLLIPTDHTSSRCDPNDKAVTKTSYRIMIVDDDDSIRRSLNTLFTKAGFEVVLASDGSEAVRLWRARAADLVITDLHMPNKDGIQTIVELLTHTPGVPIIAMSGGGQTKRLDLLGNAQLLGSVLTIEKPFTLSEMMDVVGRALPPRH
jgi:DNA-binding NtrC family response regulator